jgi:hypothetical protein
MLSFFAKATPSAVENAADIVASATATRDRIAGQAREAEARLAAARTAAVDAAAGFGAGLDDAATDVAVQQAAVDALSEARANSERALRAAQTALATATDAEERAKSVGEIEGVIASINAQAGVLLPALAALNASMQRAGEISLDCQQLAAILAVSAREWPAAFEHAVAALKYQASAIESGSVRAELAPAAEAPAPRTATEAPREVPCFPLHDIRWSAPGSGLRHAGKYWDVGLPPEVAARALLHGICVPSDSDEARKRRKDRGAMSADLDRAVNLDDANPTPPPPLGERYLRAGPTPKWSLASPAMPIPSWMRPSRPMVDAKPGDF